MRFNGRSGVEVRLPNDLEDLKGYTSLSLFLQRPESTESGGTENMFVMYLGNKDVSIALTFPWFLKQKMSFEVRDTAMSLPCQWQEIPLPLMAPWEISHQFKVVFGGGNLEALPDGPSVWALVCVHLSTSIPGAEDQHPLLSSRQQYQGFLEIRAALPHWSGLGPLLKAPSCRPSHVSGVGTLCEWGLERN